MKNKNKLGIFISIMVLSMYLNIEKIVTLAYSGLSEAFPNADISSIQNIFSLMMLTELFVNFTVGWFARKFSKRKLIIIFQGFTVLGGLIAFFFGRTLEILYGTSIMIGFASAIVSTVSKSVITENFEGEESTKVFSAQQVAQGVGTIGLQLLAGIWAVSSWRNVYLTYLFGLLSLFAALFLMPEGPKEAETFDKHGNKTKLWTKSLIHDVIIMTLFVMMFVNYDMNITYLVSEKGFGNSSVSGYLSAIWTAVLMIAAVCLSPVMKKLGKWTIAASFAVEALSFVVIALSTNIAITILAIICAAFAQGIFSPAIYISVSKHANPATITSSMAVLNGGAAAGVYLIPYLCTKPAELFGSSAQTRFLFVAVEIAALLIYELIYQKRH